MNLIVYQNLIAAILLIIGGIYAFKGKKLGGWVALIIGLVWILGGILAAVTYWDFLYLVSLSLLYYAVQVEFLYLITIEAFLAVAGGIIILVSED